MGVILMIIGVIVLTLSDTALAAADVGYEVFLNAMISMKLLTHHGHFSGDSAMKTLQCSAKPRHGQSQPQLKSQPHIGTIMTAINAPNRMTASKVHLKRIKLFIASSTITSRSG